ncbi:MAG: membrane protein [Nitrospinaceae bacterium]|nr:MAG: membrane protein [Nitrospinaceae bacterium]
MGKETDLVALIENSLKGTLIDILPILLVLLFFQGVILRKKIPNLKRILIGLVLVIVGLAIFIVGLEQCVFPIGSRMADQLTHPQFLTKGNDESLKAFFTAKEIDPWLYAWTYLFAFLIGFSTTFAEPALIAVAIKAKEISTGAITEMGLRIAVALGVAVGVALGTYRIVMGTPLYLYIVAGYLVLLIQTFFAPKMIIPLAYDSGGVTTSTVTVPVLAALGIGLASNVPGRSPIVDGFGLIAFASLFPIIAVLAYAMISQALAKST